MNIATGMSKHTDMIKKMHKHLGVYEHTKAAALMGRLAAAFVGLFILFFSLCPAVYAEVIDRVPVISPDIMGSTDPLFHDTVSFGIEMVFNERYEESIALLNSLHEKYPHHPGPHFFKTAIYQIWMSSFRINRYEKELESNVQLAIEKGNKILKQDNDPWIHFYVGASYGYRAFNRFRKNDWIGAFLDARRGVRNFREALSKEPGLYDVYLGLGTYHYWRTAKSSFLRIIAFWIPDKRELGLKQIEFSLNHGQYAPNEATYGLISAYFDYGDYEKALEILDRAMTRRQSPSTSDLYFKARLLMKFKRWMEVESLFKRIIERIKNHKLPCVGYQVEVKYWLAVVLMKQKKTSEALEWLEEALDQSRNRDGSSELEGPFESFSDIKFRLRNMQDELLGDGTNQIGP